MITQIARLFFWPAIFFLFVPTIIAQDYSSRNNYTGNWEIPTSWNPTWPVPQTNVKSLDITINGYITANSSLTFSEGTSKLIVDDTLVIKGNLTIDDNNDVQVNNYGVLIVWGDLTISPHSKIEANNYIIVTGNIIKEGSPSNGEFKSDDDPVRVFVGGTISPADLTDNQPDFTALNCTSPSTTPYPHTGCSYGDLTDIINDPIYEFFLSTCTSATPTITTSGPTTFCAGGSVTLTSSPEISYLWSTGATTQSINVTSAGSYTVQVTNASGCQSTASLPTTVTVNALPIINAGTDATIPNGTSTTIDATVTGTGPFEYSWSPAAQLVNALVEDPTTVNLATTTVFTLIATSTSTSCSNSGTVMISTSGGILTSSPTATPGTVCSGTNVQLRAIASGGSGSYSYTWTSSPVGFTSTLADPVDNPSVNTTYYVTVFDGTSTVNSQVDVTVSALPMATAGNNGPACIGSSLNLTGGPVGMTSYSWNGVNLFSSLSQSPTISTMAELAMSGEYTLTVTDANGCINTATTTVIVNQPTLLSITSSAAPLCINEERTLTGNPAGGTFVINDGPGSVSDNILLASGVGNISLEYTLPNNCDEKANQSLIVNSMPVAIPGNDQELRYIFNTQMNAELNPPDIGKWNLISGSGIIIDPASPTSLITGLSIGDNVFLWKVNNENCSDSADITIKILDLIVPSVITPNNDGKNDFFKINGLNGNIEIIILNKWGIEEYTNGNYENDWNGRSNRGYELPNDTYFYLLKFENGVIKKGSVLIKR